MVVTRSAVGSLVLAVAGALAAGCAIGTMSGGDAAREGGPRTGATDAAPVTDAALAAPDASAPPDAADPREPDGASAGRDAAAPDVYTVRDVGPPLDAVAPADAGPPPVDAAPPVDAGPLPAFCPDANVRRGESAVPVLRVRYGATYAPPAAMGAFTDVPVADPLAPWIEQLRRDGITLGCSATMYCPGDDLLRAQLAVFLVRARHGGTFTPPPATGSVYDDVMAAATGMEPFIEQLATDDVALPCSPRHYCPNDGLTRGEFAAFIVRGHTPGASAPPAPSGAVFRDVPASHPWAAWIEQAARLGLVPPCG